MSATRPSRRARRKDLTIHEALVAGYSNEQVAQRMGLAVEQVRAAQQRVLDARASLDQREANIAQQRDALDAILLLAIDAFHGSTAPEETTKISRDDVRPGAKV